MVKLTSDSPTSTLVSALKLSIKSNNVSRCSHTAGLIGSITRVSSLTALTLNTEHVD